MPKSLEPGDVFTPNGFPLGKNQVYAAREDAERLIKRGLGRSKTPIIFGEYGVGKTTLVKRYFSTEAAEGRLAEFLTPSGKSFKDLIAMILELMDYEVSIGTEQKTGSSVEGSVEGGLWGTIKAKLSGKVEESTTRKSELLVRSPTDQGFLRVAAEARMVITIDELHKASDEFRRELAEAIKAANNLGLGYPKFVLIGTTLEPTKLVTYDAGIDRLVEEVKLNLMSTEESTFVVEDGMKRLEVEIPEELRARIVTTASGAPSLLQEICFDVAEAATRRSPRQVEEEDVDDAIKTFLLTSEARLTRRYMMGANTVGSRQYRKQILRAVAESDSEFVTMDELTTRVGAIVKESVPSTALSGPLRELKTKQYGDILMDVDRPEGQRAHNLTMFRDPRMKAFIRAMVAVEDQGLLPSSSELAALPPADLDD